MTMSRYDRATWHTLTNIDPVAKTGTCAQCGPVSVRRVSRALPPRFKCAKKDNAQKLDYQKRNKTYRKRVQRHGLTLEEAAAFRKGKSCAICGTPPTGRAPHCIDHCHTTGRLRGVLCIACNVRLAALEDPAWLTAAQAYLEQS